MKQLSLFEKFVFTVNFIFSFLLLMSCAAPYISVELFPFLTLLSLSVPILFGMNVLFLLYWTLKMKRQLLMSLAVLTVCYFSFGTFVKLNFPEKDLSSSQTDLKVMSYNVRSFNTNRNIDSETIFEDIKVLVDNEDPDIICFQEVGRLKRKEYSAYPYKHLEFKNRRNKSLAGILSKYPILHAELLPFNESFNTAAFADILYKNDTIRVYSLHMESLGIRGRTYAQDRSDNIYQKLSTSFKKQQEQAQFIIEHSSGVRYKKIICGDFNNSQFSRLYRLVKGNMSDTFLEKGSGFGRTYDFMGLPQRIDFILADSDFEVISHKNFDEKYSDHFPIVASFRFKKD